VDFGGFEIGGLSVLVLVLGIVEACKRFGVTGKASEALAIGLGAFFVGLAKALAAGLLPAWAVVWAEIVVVGLGGGLAATGVYDLVRRAVAGPPGGA